MQVQIRFSGGDRQSFGVHDYEEMVATSLRRFEHQLRQVYLYLEDVNGPRGGIDKQCRCVLHLRRMPPIVITDQDESTTALLHRVLGRATYTLSQKADRRVKRGVRSGSAVRELTAQPG